MAEWADRFWTVRDGLRIHYRDYDGPDDRPPILCLPGLTRNSRDFAQLADRLAGRWRLLALEFRGRGLSDHDPQPERYVPPTYAGDVLELLDGLGIPRALFIGTSLGGIVTMLVAAVQPQRLAGALINDIGPEISEAGLVRIRKFVGRPASFASWTEAAAAVAEINGPAFPGYGPADWEAFARRICRQDNGAIRFDYDMDIARVFNGDGGVPQHFWPLVDGLSAVPVTILRGELSDLFSAATADRMAGQLPGAELVTVQGVGHAPMLDEPEAEAAIDRLLARVLD